MIELKSWLESPKSKATFILCQGSLC